MVFIADKYWMHMMGAHSTSYPTCLICMVEIHNKLEQLLFTHISCVTEYNNPYELQSWLWNMKYYMEKYGFSSLWPSDIIWRQGSLQRRHYGHDSVSNHQPHDCLLNRLFRRRSKKTSTLRVTGLCAANSPVTGEFPAQMASYVENASIWWRHHDLGQHWLR